MYGQVDTKQKIKIAFGCPNVNVNFEKLLVLDESMSRDEVVAEIEKCVNHFWPFVEGWNESLAAAKELAAKQVAEKKAKSILAGKEAAKKAKLELK